jgi:hypothetical protein
MLPADADVETLCTQLLLVPAQVALVASHSDKLTLRFLDVLTGDIAVPRFVQPPVMRSTSTGLSVAFAVDKPARLDWAIAYDTVSANFRDQLLGFKSSALSTPQVVDAVRVAEVNGSTALRRLHAEKVTDVGPVVASGFAAVDALQTPLAIHLMTPCLNDSGMCRTHEDALNPFTRYKVWCCVLGNSG